MAAVTEVGVSVLLTVRRGDADGTAHVYAEGFSTDVDGTMVRKSHIVDITEFLTPQQVTGAGNVLTAAENRLKNQWNIP